MRENKDESRVRLSKQRKGLCIVTFDTSFAYALFLAEIEKPSSTSEENGEQWKICLVSCLFFIVSY